jgi:zinc protease
VQSEATADALREAIGEIRAIRADRPITRPELELGRASLTRGYPRNFETADQIARGGAQLALYDLPDDYFSTFVPKVLALSETEVTAAAVKHIDPARLLAVVVGDREKLMSSLKTLELGDVTDVSIT